MIFGASLSQFLFEGKQLKQEKIYNMRAFLISFLFIFAACHSQPNFQKDGGLRIVIEIGANEDNTEAREKCKVVLQKRLDQFGIESPIIRNGKKNNEIVIEIPGKNDLVRIKKLLESSSKISFSETPDNFEMYPKLESLNDLIAKENGVTREVITPKADSSLQGQLAKTAPPKKSVDQLRRENPLFAILSPSIQRKSNGDSELAKGPVIGFSSANDTGKVMEMLNSETAKKIFGPYLKFVWNFKALKNSDVYSLFAIKINRDGKVYLTGDIIESARLGYDKPEDGKS
jgi:SecD/SecF fusion protein